MSQPLRSAEIRRQNRAAILRVLQRHPQTRARIADLTGLSAPTVTKVTAELIEDGVVVKHRGSPSRAGQVGRPGTDLELVRDSALALGLFIGDGGVEAVLCDAAATPLKKGRVVFDSDAGQDRALREIASKAARLLAGVSAQGRAVVGVGVGMPGPVDKAGRRAVGTIFLDWQDAPVADVFEEVLQRPVIVDHHVRALAFAEAYHGIGVDDPDLAYVYLSRGIGAGLVLDGHVYQGGASGVTEIGHLKVVEDGRPCLCGDRGCLETVVSEAILSENALVAAHAEPAGAIAAAMDRGVAPPLALSHAALAGDEHARTLLRTAGHDLGRAVVTIVDLLSPTLIILGGLAATPDGIIVDAVRQVVADLAFPIVRDAIRVEPTSLTEHANAIGAATRALDAFFYCPLGED